MSSTAISSPSPFSPVLMQPLPLALNHLLHQELWVQETLRPFAGRVAHFDLVPMSTTLQADAADPVTASAPDVEPAAIVVVPLTAAAGDYVTGGQVAVFKHVRIEGEAELANVLSTLLRNLCWDAAEDFSRVFGGVIAQRMVSGVQTARTETMCVSRSLAESVASYLIDEQPTLVRHACLVQFVADVAALCDAEARPVKRLKRFEELPQPVTRTARQGEST